MSFSKIHFKLSIRYHFIHFLANVFSLKYDFVTIDFKSIKNDIKVINIKKNVNILSEKEISEFAAVAPWYNSAIIAEKIPNNSIFLLDWSFNSVLISSSLLIKFEVK